VLIVLVRRHYGLQPDNAEGGIALQAGALPTIRQAPDGRYLANWTGFASNFALQFFEQK
jgi:hypothetical protein